MARPWALPLGLLLAASALCASGYVSDRITEKEIHFDLDFLGDTPVVDPPKRIAGYFKLNRTHDARMFYFFFQSRSKDAAKDPLVLWMTGGPGCSSEIAIFFENGPYSINADRKTLTETKYGWDTYHNMIFVDQPIGTGFSYSGDWRDTVFDETRVGQDMLDFLWEFYRVHPEMQANPFYVTGESYAGHYVPAVSSAIYRANELGQGPMTIPLAGLAIGNGMTHPSIQFPAYADFALENKLISQGLHDSIQWWMPLCTWGAEFCDSHKWRLACTIALQVCQLTSFERILMANPGINVYDITKKCEGDLCYDMSAADDFLNQPEVRKELGVGNREWSECNMDVNGNFMGDWLRSYDDLLPPLLEDGIRVMIYAGDLDLICNWLGNERWVDVMDWERSSEWPSVAAVEWAVEKAVAGSVRELGPLSFVKVYQAGHMVPMDQPRNALGMMWRFTRNQSLTAPPDLMDPELRTLLAQPTPAERLAAHASASASTASTSAVEAAAVETEAEVQAHGSKAVAAGAEARHRESTHRSDKGLLPGQVLGEEGVRHAMGRHAGGGLRTEEAGAAEEVERAEV
ncbi:hypothetical protein HYH03_009297 [Edaphochlamys debaryana]|uniref:Carboxypeptidase n=1 Tax=Edaphochlamys debaryana TaxID=47281 RepID=A0A835Y7D6_9CHLO|nr:hypothetical protein HYH03_009297 [Edaphochlamys debaryana]|eukprot:KAG2492349.1 hypothetical protein HYH03_009297 [Edaphochlamys debaryana]